MLKKVNQSNELLYTLHKYKFKATQEYMWMEVRACVFASVDVNQTNQGQGSKHEQTLHDYTNQHSGTSFRAKHQPFIFIYVYVYISFMYLMLQRIFQCTCVFVAWHDIGVRKLLRQCVCVFVCSVALVKLLEWLFIGPNHGYT